MADINKMVFLLQYFILYNYHMKRLFTLLLIVIAGQFCFAASFIKELENSVERARKGSKVEYVLHLSTAEEKIITGHDFTTVEVIRKGDIPLYFELYKSSGDKKQNIMINLQNAAYHQLNVE